MATITVKNIPDELYARLKAVAASNRRSINGEIIRRIERSLTPRRAPTEQLLARIGRLHDSFEDRAFTLEQIEEARREGRP
jgi:plasmid stability protein